jgi:hypothetical protein
MRDLPVVLSGYKCTVVDPPQPKTRDDGSGGQVVVTDLVTRAAPSAGATSLSASGGPSLSSGWA